MDFAKKQLEKYGWKDGEGLGKNGTGITKPLKPKLKFDTCGLGQNHPEEFSNTWWQRVYDDAAKSIATKTNGDSILFESSSEPFVINTKKGEKSKNKQQRYNGFVKTAELTKLGEKSILQEHHHEIGENDNEDCKNPQMTSGVCDLTDEELFKACGGRTVHKGARHGLKMNAKLLRIQKQESLLNSVKFSNVAESASEKVTSAKKKKLDKVNQFDGATDNNVVNDSDSKSKKKKKKKTKKNKKEREQ